jgi:ADP-heptose:LPS heptosyltransferase
MPRARVHDKKCVFREKHLLLREAIRLARYAALLCVDVLLILTRTATPRSGRVLLVRVDGIGDFVLWLDAAQATVSYYRKRNKNVILVADAAWAEWARDLAAFDDVVALNRNKYKRNLAYRYRMGAKIRRLGCGIAVQPTYSREWLAGDSVVRVSGAVERIGSSGNEANVKPWQRQTGNVWYTRLIDADPHPQMELIRNAQFVRALGETNYRAKVFNLRQVSTLETGEAFTSALAGHGKFYVLFPGANWAGRRWPVANFAKIAGKLHSKTGWHGVICGSAGDREISEKLCEQCDVPILNWAGRSDLPQLAAIISAAQLVVTNDTSATHIAAACGVAAICILAGGHFGRFLPYRVEQADGRPLPRAIFHDMPCFGCSWNCIYGQSATNPTPCIEQIEVTEVWRVVEELSQGWPDGRDGTEKADGVIFAGRKGTENHVENRERRSPMGL